MPQIFKLGSYLVYFWSNEGEPLEPIHVHVAEKIPQENGTKIWITRTGKTLLCHNKSEIPEHTLNNIRRIIEARVSVVTAKWIKQFKKISYYC